MRPITMLAVSLAMWLALAGAGLYATHLVNSAARAIASWQAMPAEQIALGRE